MENTLSTHNVTLVRRKTSCYMVIKYCCPYCCLEGSGINTEISFVCYCKRMLENIYFFP